MCNPMALQGLSTGFEAVGALRQGGQQKAFYDFQAAQGEADADAAVGQSTVNANIVRKAGALQRGTARAAIARSGVAVDAGSASQAVDTINREAELDAMTQLLTGKYTANRLRTQADMSRRAGQLAMKNANWAAAGSVLAGGAKMASMRG